MLSLPLVWLWREKASALPDSCSEWDSCCAHQCRALWLLFCWEMSVLPGLKCASQTGCVFLVECIPFRSASLIQSKWTIPVSGTVFLCDWMLVSQMSITWNSKLRVTMLEGKKENLTSHFVTWNLVSSPFPCLISAYLTLKQTEKELNPNLSEVLCCSWFCCCCVVFFIFFVLLLYGCINHPLLYCILSPLFFSSIVFVSLVHDWHLFDFLVISKEFIHPWKGLVDPRNNTSLLLCRTFPGNVKNNSYKLQELIIHNTGG